MADTPKRLTPKTLEEKLLLLKKILNVGSPDFKDKDIMLSWWHTFRFTDEDAFDAAATELKKNSCYFPKQSQMWGAVKDFEKRRAWAINEEITGRNIDRKTECDKCCDSGLVTATKDGNGHTFSFRCTCRFGMAKAKRIPEWGGGHSGGFELI